MTDGEDERATASDGSYDDHLDEYIDALRADDHRAFFAVTDSVRAERTAVVYSSGVDQSRLRPLDADLVQLVLLSQHIQAVAERFDLPESELLRIARYWHMEAADDLDSVLGDQYHPIESAEGRTLRSGSEFRVDEELE